MCCGKRRGENSGKEKRRGPCWMEIAVRSGKAWNSRLNSTQEGVALGFCKKWWDLWKEVFQEKGGSVSLKGTGDPSSGPSTQPKVREEGGWLGTRGGRATQKRSSCLRALLKHRKPC